MKTNLWVKHHVYICIQSRCPIAKFNNFLLKMCNFNSLKNTTIWKESDINNVVKSIKNELCERFNIMWKVQIQQLSKLQVLKLVKPSIEFESYLSQVKIVKHRQAVIRFRISAHKLPIETGRYANIEHDIYVYVQFVTQMRLGTNITTFHIRLEKLRENFLNDHELVDFNCKFSSLGTNNLFLYCVSMNDKNIINSRAKYIYEIMNTFWDLACI